MNSRRNVVLVPVASPKTQILEPPHGFVGDPVYDYTFNVFVQKRLKDGHPRAHNSAIMAAIDLTTAVRNGMSKEKAYARWHIDEFVREIDSLDHIVKVNREVKIQRIKEVWPEERELVYAPRLLFRGGCFPRGSIGKQQVTDCNTGKTRIEEKQKWEKTNGQYHLTVQTMGKQGLPFGNFSRLIMIYITSQLVKTQGDPVIFLGKCLDDLVFRLGLKEDYKNTSGGKRSTRHAIKQHLLRILNSIYSIHVNHGSDDKHEAAFLKVCKSYNLDFLEGKADRAQLALWDGQFKLDADFAEELYKSAPPLDLRIIRAHNQNSLTLDLYMWLTGRLFALNHSSKTNAYIPISELHLQFGGYKYQSDFVRVLKKSFSELHRTWPGLNYGFLRGRLVLSKSELTIPKQLMNTYEAKRIGPS